MPLFLICCSEQFHSYREVIENGYNYTEISEKYKVGYQQIYTWVQKYKKDGEDALNIMVPLSRPLLKK